MSLIAKEQEHFLDPLSEKISEKLRCCSNGAIIDRFMLREFVFKRAKRIVIQKHPDWISENKIDGDTLNRLVDFNVRLDYDQDLTRIVQEFNMMCQEQSKDTVFIDRATEHKKVQLQIFEKEIPETRKDREIDKVIASGRRTKLHVACENGDYNEVKRLVEICGAKVGIKDASNWTPRDRAKLSNKTENHAKIIAYLDNFVNKNI